MHAFYAQACITFHVQPARLRRSGNCCTTFSYRRIEPDRFGAAKGAVLVDGGSVRKGQFWPLVCRCLHRVGAGWGPTAQTFVP